MEKDKYEVHLETTIDRLRREGRDLLAKADVLCQALADYRNMKAKGELR